MKTIAVVDDDVYIGDLLEELLTAEGYAVLRAYSGTEAVMLLESKRADLVLLDLMLPGLSGEQVLERLNGVPVIVLSARSAIEDKVKLLLSGAEDYITKPFDTAELLARVKVRLRSGGQGSACLESGNMRLDTASHELLVDSVPVHLTRTEYAILHLLMKNQDHVMAKSKILEDIFYDTPDCTEDSLKIHISNLRRKLSEAGANGSIEAVWGIGFRFFTKS